MDKNDKKLKFFALVKTAIARDQVLEYPVIAEYLEVKPALLQRWFNEFKKQASADSILKLVDLDKIMVSRLVDLVAEEVVELDTFRVNEAGVIELVELSEDTETKIETFKDSVSGLQALQIDLQTTAASVIQKIRSESRKTDLTAKEIASLASAVSSIQNAFFNRPTTNIQVNTGLPTNEGGSPMLTSFKQGLKP